VKLVHRVSAFFLSALALVLLAYSIVFYVLARTWLVWQFEHELHGTLHALVAAVEVEPEEVKWQPLEHTITMETGATADSVQWIVLGDRQTVVEKSRHAGPDLVELARTIAADSPPTAEQWVQIHQRLVAPRPLHDDREVDEFDELLIVAARSAAPLRADLMRLAGLVSLLPLVAWLAAAALGHRLCRRAVQPVMEMARLAREATGMPFDVRLPVADARDELGDLASAFNTLLARLQHFFNEQRQFAGNAAHELRTPLTVLRGQIEVALRRPRSAEESAQTLSLLRDQTVQLQNLVESLLFLARSEDDAVPPDVETLDVRDWVSCRIASWSPHPRSRDLRCEMELTGPVWISASRSLLSRLLDNLIENAFKFSEPGTPVTLKVRIDPESGPVRSCPTVSIQVTDRGCGVAAEERVAIFTPFYRTRSALDRRVAGTGLGLAIAARIARTCGATLQCESPSGGGSAFRLDLPRIVPN